MPLLLVLILVLIAFGLLLVGFLSSSVVWAWVSVLVSAAAAVVLIVDTVQRRSAVRAGDDAVDPAREPEPATAMARSSGSSRAGSGATAVVPAPPSPPQPPRRRELPEPVTEVIPVVRPSGWAPSTAPSAPLSDAEQTVVMPAVQPSGSSSGPLGAVRGNTPSREDLSPAVTAGPAPAVDETRAVPAGGDVAPPPESTVVVPGVAAGAPERSSDGPDPDDAAPVAAPPESGPSRPVTLDKPVPADPAQIDPTPSRSNGSGRAPVTPPAAVPPPPAVPPAAAVPPPPVVPPVIPPPPDTAADSGSVPPRADGPGRDDSGRDDSDRAPAGRTAPARDEVPPPVEATTALAGTGGPPGDTRAIDRTSASDLPAEEDGTPPEEPHDPDAAALVAGLPDEVLVIDEQPRYHVPGCRTLLDAPPIPLPVQEAVELGFTPCGWCTPDRTLASRHAPARS